MEPITIHKGLVYPLNRANIDTDQIIPKQFLKRIERSGFGQFLFYNWRFHDNGTVREDFSLNDDKFSDTSILVAGENFGCGSSREHAPWALLDYGFRVIIAPSFADIFYNNSVKNGILPIKLSEEKIQELVQSAQNGGYELTVNLPELSISDHNGFETTFHLSEYHQDMLINGMDEIALTLTLEDKILQYEERENK